MGSVVAGSHDQTQPFPRTLPSTVVSIDPLITFIPSGCLLLSDQRESGERDAGERLAGLLFHVIYPTALSWLI